MVKIVYIFIIKYTKYYDFWSVKNIYHYQTSKYWSKPNGCVCMCLLVCTTAAHVFLQYGNGDNGWWVGMGGCLIHEQCKSVTTLTGKAWVWLIPSSFRHLLWSFSIYLFPTMHVSMLTIWRFCWEWYVKRLNCIFCLGSVVLATVSFSSDNIVYIKVIAEMWEFGEVRRSNKREQSNNQRGFQQPNLFI